MLHLIIGNKNYSSWSLRPWLLLRMLGIDFKETRIPLDTETFAADIARYSPAGRVPVLIHDDLHVWDSLAICEYVAELHPDLPAWPAGRIDRARARSISAEMHSSFMGLRATLPMNCRRLIPGYPLPDEARDDVARVREIWGDCLRENREGGWLFGEFSIADAMYAPVVMRFLTYDVELDDRLRAYCELVAECGPMREWRAAGADEVEILENEEVTWP